MSNKYITYSNIILEVQCAVVVTCIGFIIEETGSDKDEATSKDIGI